MAKFGREKHWQAVVIVTVNFLNSLCSAMKPLITNGQPVRCDWLNQCPIGSFCDLKPQHYPTFHVCYKIDSSVTVDDLLIGSNDDEFSAKPIIPIGKPERPKLPMQVTNIGTPIPQRVTPIPQILFSTRPQFTYYSTPATTLSPPPRTQYQTTVANKFEQEYNIPRIPFYPFPPLLFLQNLNHNQNQNRMTSAAHEDQPGNDGSQKVAREMMEPMDQQLPLPPPYRSNNKTRDLLASWITAGDSLSSRESWNVKETKYPRGSNKEKLYTMAPLMEQFVRPVVQCPTPDQTTTCEPCQTSTDCQPGFACCFNGKGNTCSAPIGSPENEPRVIPLAIGNYEPVMRKGLPLSLEMNGSVTLVRTQGQNILVDSGTPASRDSLITSLSLLGLSTQDINYVILTHGHLDHTSNVNLFNNAVKITGKFTITGNVFSASPLMTGDRYDLCMRRVYVLDTPGHAPQDITLVIENVNGLGTVAVTGDLFVKDTDVLSSPELWRAQAWNTTAQEQSRRKVACLADWIIPGHGPMFKVSSVIRDAFNCPRENGGVKYSTLYSGGGRQNIPIEPLILKRNLHLPKNHTVKHQNSAERKPNDKKSVV